MRAACNNDISDLSSVMGRMFSAGIAPPTSSTSIASAALIPGPHIGPATYTTQWSENGADYGPQLRGSDYLPYVALANQGQVSSSSYTQSASNGTINDKAIVWSLVNTWDSDAKVLTCTVEVDSTASYNPGGTGPATSYSVTTDPANGDAVAEMLGRMSSDFFFSHGLSGGTMTSYSSGNAPAGLVSIKIETL